MKPPRLKNMKRKVWEDAPDISEFPEKEEAAWRALLDKDEEYNITDYLNEGYEYINHVLREKPISEQERRRALRPEHVLETIKFIDRAIAKGKTTKEFVCYRSIIDKDTSDIAVSGAVFQDKAFVSTSLSKKTAESYIQHNIRITKRNDIIPLLLKIKIPAGSRVAYNKLEHELVLPRDSRFRVESVTEQNGVKYAEAVLLHE